MAEQVLIARKPIDRADEIESAWRACFERLEPKLFANLSDRTRASDSEVNRALMQILDAEKKTEATCALLYGILTEPEAAQKYLHYLTWLTQDQFVGCVNHLKRFVGKRYRKMQDTCRAQVFWLIESLIGQEIRAAADVVLALLKQILIGDMSERNLMLVSRLVDLIAGHLEFFYQQNSTLPFIFYNLVAHLPDLINDSVAPTTTAQNQPATLSTSGGKGESPQIQLINTIRVKDVQLCIKLVREKFADILHIGRDLVRLIQNCQRIPEFEALWREILTQPRQLQPDFSGVTRLLTYKTSRALINSCVTPEMEEWLIFLFKEVKMGMQPRYQEWYRLEFLSFEMSDHLIPFLIRYIVACFHPDNDMLRSDLVTRWAVIGWLLKSCRAPQALECAKQALLLDFFFFDPVHDRIMNLEPAVLLMLHSIPKYMDITLGLLEFIVCEIERYDGMDLALKPIVRQSITAAFNECLHKKVIRSLAPIVQIVPQNSALRSKMFVDPNSPFLLFEKDDLIRKDEPRKLEKPAIDGTLLDSLPHLNSLNNAATGTTGGTQSQAPPRKQAVGPSPPPTPKRKAQNSPTQLANPAEVKKILEQEAAIKAMQPPQALSKSLQVPGSSILRNSKERDASLLSDSNNGLFVSPQVNSNQVPPLVTLKRTRDDELKGNDVAAMDAFHSATPQLSNPRTTKRNKLEGASSLANGGERDLLMDVEGNGIAIASGLLDSPVSKASNNNNSNYKSSAVSSDDQIFMQWPSLRSKEEQSKSASNQTNSPDHRTEMSCCHELFGEALRALRVEVSSEKTMKKGEKNTDSRATLGNLLTSFVEFATADSNGNAKSEKNLDAAGNALTPRAIVTIREMARSLVEVFHSLSEFTSTMQVESTHSLSTNNNNSSGSAIETASSAHNSLHRLIFERFLEASIPNSLALNRDDAMVEEETESEKNVRLSPTKRGKAKGKKNNESAKSQATVKTTTNASKLLPLPRSAAALALLQLLVELQSLESSISFRLLLYLLSQCKSPHILLTRSDSLGAEQSTEDSAYKSFLSHLSTPNPLERDPTLIMELFVSFLDSSISSSDQNELNSQQAFLESSQNLLDYDQIQFFDNFLNICKYLPKFTVGNSQFIHLFCRYIYPTQLLELCGSLTLAQFSLFRKNALTTYSAKSKSTQSSADASAWQWIDLSPLLRYSLAWTAYEQQCLWQLLFAESSATQAPDRDLFFTLLQFVESHVEIVALFSHSEHAAALQGCLSILASFQPLANRLTRVLAMPMRFSGLIVSALLARWLVASSDGSLLVAQLQSVLDSLLPLPQNSSQIDAVLRHLTVFRLFNSEYFHVLFSAGVNARIVKVIEKFKLAGAFAELYKSCK